MVLVLNLLHWLFESGELQFFRLLISDFWLFNVYVYSGTHGQAVSPIDIRKFHRIVGSIYFSAVWESKTLILTAFIRDEDEKEVDTENLWLCYG